MKAGLIVYDFFPRKKHNNFYRSEPPQTRANLAILEVSRFQYHLNLSGFLDMQVSLAKMILPILIKFEHFQCIFIGCQVKQAAVEQIRCARQASEEACWQCGRPATETCSGISQKQKTNSKTKKKTQKYQFEHFFGIFRIVADPPYL